MKSPVLRLEPVLSEVNYYIHWTLSAKPTNNHSHVALISQLVEHCTNNVQVVGLNPVQNLNSFLGLFSSSVNTAFKSIIYISLLLLDIYYYLVKFIIKQSLNWTQKLENCQICAILHCVLYIFVQG